MNTTDIRNIAMTIAAGIVGAAAGYSLYAEIQSETRSKAEHDAHTKRMDQQDRRDQEFWDRQQAEHEAFMARHGMTTTRHR
jgi:O-methyltransferase involved in polyketide biosynthesis